MVSLTHGITGRTPKQMRAHSTQNGQQQKKQEKTSKKVPNPSASFRQNEKQILPLSERSEIDEKKTKNQRKERGKGWKGEGVEKKEKEDRGREE